MLHTARAQAAVAVAAMQRATGEALHGAAWPALLRALQATARSPSSTPGASSPYRLGASRPGWFLCGTASRDGSFVPGRLGRDMRWGGCSRIPFPSKGPEEMVVAEHFCVRQSAIDCFGEWLADSSRNGSGALTARMRSFACSDCQCRRFSWILTVALPWVSLRLKISVGRRGAGGGGRG